MKNALITVAWSVTMAASTAWAVGDQTRRTTGNITGSHSASPRHRAAGTVDGNGCANPQPKGGNRIMNRYLVNGHNIPDPFVNPFAHNSNFGPTSRVELHTGAMEAQPTTPGDIINLNPAGGSDEWLV